MPQTTTMLRSLTLLWKRMVVLYTKDIWQPNHMGEKSIRGWSYATLRVISITITGIFATRAFARAAALSFTTLLSLGPLIALAVLVAGFALKQEDPDMIGNKLNDMIKFIAPQVDHYEDIRQKQRSTRVPTISARPETPGVRGTPALPPTEAPAPATPANPESVKNAPSAVEKGATATASVAAAADQTADGTDATQPEVGQRKVRPEIVKLINNFVTNARSGTIGGISALTLIVIVILLFGAIEDVFNDIWGVRRTRSWLIRVVFYWAILTLGTVIFSVAIGTLSAATFENFFRDKIPLGSQMVAMAQFFMPAVVIVLVIGALTMFYKYIPNTNVYWRAAFTGAVVMAVLLVGNNMIAFTYFRRIEITQSLYGSLGIVPVLMLGLYVFWLIVLIGGQVSYAVQNVHFRNSQVAWGTLSHSRRERLTLIVFLTITRRFQACMPPCSVLQLGDTIKAPTQILNECLNRLIDLKLISPIPSMVKGEASSGYLYQPSRPLSKITLGEFKELFENLGEDPSGTLIDRLDPVGVDYHAAVIALNHEPLFSKSLEELFNENPVDDTHPPFALTDKAAPRDKN